MVLWWDDENLRNHDKPKIDRTKEGSPLISSIPALISSGWREQLISQFQTD